MRTVQRMEWSLSLSEGLTSGALHVNTRQTDVMRPRTGTTTQRDGKLGECTIKWDRKGMRKLVQGGCTIEKNNNLQFFLFGSVRPRPVWLCLAGSKIENVSRFSSHGPVP